MADIMLNVNKVSKQYRLGLIGTGTLSHDLNRWWRKLIGKDDPFLKIGELNNRKVRGNSDYVWALQDISFEVRKGEVLGIIGENGAGKSTLLKILSRVTGPTTGEIKTKGRIASLLEVGTGFHPEMTGRENIFLNGAILGMTKKEIASKINEIIDFSGCERYIDTPVKRYSSGMRVRLAFAVAAHLEPDILVIDEVLAVGDAEFQKKAIGKMQDISKGEGRTVLFVSHNMAAIETLCDRVIVLKDGRFFDEGTPTEAINNYLKNSTFSQRIIEFNKNGIVDVKEGIQMIYAGVENASAEHVDDVLDVTSEIDIRFKFINKTKGKVLSFGYDLKNIREEVIFGSGSKFTCNINEVTELVCRIPANFLNDDMYQIHLYAHSEAMNLLYSEKDLLTFEIKDIKRESGYLGRINGVIRPKLLWQSVSDK